MGFSVVNNFGPLADRGCPSMAVQPKLGILAQRRPRNDSLDCLDSLAAWVRVGPGVMAERRDNHVKRFVTTQAAGWDRYLQGKKLRHRLDSVVDVLTSQCRIHPSGE